MLHVWIDLSLSLPCHSRFSEPNAIVDIRYDIIRTTIPRLFAFNGWALNWLMYLGWTLSLNVKFPCENCSLFIQSSVRVRCIFSVRNWIYGLHFIFIVFSSMAVFQSFSLVCWFDFLSFRSWNCLMNDRHSFILFFLFFFPKHIFFLSLNFNKTVRLSQIQLDYF